MSLVSRDHDEQRRRRRVPRAARREPAAGHEPRAVHGDRGAGRRFDRLPARRAMAGRPVRGPARLRRDHDGSRRHRRGPAPRRRSRRRRGRTRPTPGPGTAGDVPTVGPETVRTGLSVRNLGRGVVGATGAGVTSALLGIGGGIIKVPLMHLAMGVPLRVATATSNLMIGITAAAGAVDLPAARRDRPVRRRPDRDRRVPGGVGR